MIVATNLKLCLRLILLKLTESPIVNIYIININSIQFLQFLIISYIFSWRIPLFNISWLFLNLTALIKFIWILLWSINGWKFLNFHICLFGNKEIMCLIMTELRIQIIPGIRRFKITPSLIRIICANCLSKLVIWRFYLSLNYMFMLNVNMHLLR